MEFGLLWHDGDALTRAQFYDSRDLRRVSGHDHRQRSPVQDIAPFRDMGFEGSLVGDAALVPDDAGEFRD